MKVAGCGFGVLFAIGLLWQFSSHGGIGWWLFLAALAALSGWVWAYCMWFVFSAIYLQGAASGSHGPDDKRGA